ncbi:hypothetical protein PENTCL1PPCAC_23988, partial [Pristionchus entomophagus]
VEKKGHALNQLSLSTHHRKDTNRQGDQVHYRHHGRYRDGGQKQGVFRFRHEPENRRPCSGDASWNEIINTTVLELCFLFNL